ncbi:ABC-2 transporter permease [Anaeromicropila populeti]|uniref:ABC-2 family transporter protein n=1 Tax=Anaeromicropila populeti TaxID=37658 RepID=A0A1I6J1Z2_9FIRM|nr:ABC-2 transporter permease [Anaeromicropila populeti]SFR72983.1 ABC-2 family transporter protein [Anaeromicropila populeti]
MSGLLLKDIYNLRRYLKSIIIILVFYLVYSISIKNINFFLGMTFVLMSMIPLSAIGYDERAKWDKYALTMPVSRTDMVTSKYLLALGIGGLCMIANVMLSIIIQKSSLMEAILASGAMLFLSLLYDCILLPVVFKLGVEKGRYVMFAVLLIPAIGVMYLKKLPKPDQSVIETGMKAAPFIIVVLFILSMMLSVHIYKSKELD